MRWTRIHREGFTVLFVFLSSLISFAASAEEELVNYGEDVTNPVNRFDLRLQLKTLPDATFSGQIFDDRHVETLTLRSDFSFFPKPNQLSLRFELPLVWSNKPTSDNGAGHTEFGLGDLLLQAAYIRTFNARWAGAIGLQTVLPTETGRAFGSGKWQVAPSAAIRASLPEISAGSYAGLVVRQFVSVAGSDSRDDINDLALEPQLNIGLPNQWFFNTSPKIRYNFETKGWFVPLDLMVGKKFGSRWIASLEYQYGLVREDDKYHQWFEARVGYFF